MKRPQFSIRLMLLVVAFIGACLGWRAAVVSGQRAERSTNLIMQKWELFQMEKSASRLEEKLQRRNEYFGKDADAIYLKTRKKQIAHMKKKIAELSD